MIKKGFTLSEVLITLAIIGIVAVLTIPTFVKTYRKKVFASKIVKVVSQIQDAITSEMTAEQTTDLTQTRMMQANSCSDAANGVCEAGMGYFFNKYFKLSKKTCATNDCYASSYKTKSGGAGGAISGTCVQTIDGVTLCWLYNSPHHHVDLFIDVNGPEDPNIVGYDAFYFLINAGDNRPRIWDIADSSHCNIKNGSLGGIAGYATGCYNLIMEHGGKIPD